MQYSLNYISSTSLGQTTIEQQIYSVIWSVCGWEIKSIPKDGQNDKWAIPVEYAEVWICDGCLSCD